VGDDGAQSGFPDVQMGLFEALAGGADQRWRRGFLRWMQHRPCRARLVVAKARLSLEPEPRDLYSCVWALVAELVAGGWQIRTCPAPACGKYVGQWTKRVRRFCDDGCRTAFHNAKRTKGPAKPYRLPKSKPPRR
jgi:hypothetical protein